MVFERTFSYWWSVAQESPESARVDPKSSLAGRGAAFALDRTNSRKISGVEVFVCLKFVGCPGPEVAKRWWHTHTHIYIYIYTYIKFIKRNAGVQVSVRSDFGRTEPSSPAGSWFCSRPFSQECTLARGHFSAGLLVTKNHAEFLLEFCRMSYGKSLLAGWSISRNFP